MVKFLLLVIIFLLIYIIFFKNKSQKSVSDKSNSSKTNKNDLNELVACETCNIFVPVSDAIKIDDKHYCSTSGETINNIKYFCSKKCADQYFQKR